MKTFLLIWTISLWSDAITTDHAIIKADTVEQCYNIGLNITQKHDKSSRSVTISCDEVQQ